jgi:DNA modification methylase
VDEDGEAQVLRFGEMHYAEWVEILHSFVPPGGAIVDLTSGSGSLGLAALRLKRQAILVEKDPSIVEPATVRLKCFLQYLIGLLG